MSSTNHTAIVLDGDDLRAARRVMRQTIGHLTIALALGDGEDAIDMVVDLREHTGVVIALGRPGEPLAVDGLPHEHWGRLDDAQAVMLARAAGREAEFAGDILRGEAWGDDITDAADAAMV